MNNKAELKHHLRWRDGREFASRVQLQAERNGQMMSLRRLHAAEAFHLCNGRIAEVSAEDGNSKVIWRVILVAKPDVTRRVGNATGVLRGAVRVEKKFVRRYLDDGVTRVNAVGLVHQFNHVDERDLPLYRMAQLDALGYHWPYRKIGL
jgi:hypothetical protein